MCTGRQHLEAIDTVWLSLAGLQPRQEWRGPTRQFILVGGAKRQATLEGLWLAAGGSHVFLERCFSRMDSLQPC